MLKITHETIQTMVARIADQFHPDKVILFGSYARGNPTADSDVDLLVIMNYPGRRLELLQMIRQSLQDIPTPKDIIIRTPEEVEKYGRYIGTVLYPALKEGQVMYEKG
jgi:uncharacterized protein